MLVIPFSFFRRSAKEGVVYKRISLIKYQKALTRRLNSISKFTFLASLDPDGF
jgi:hypothetical protein